MAVSVGLFVCSRAYLRNYCLNLSGHLIVQISLRFYGMRSRGCFYIECVCFFMGKM